MTKQLKTIIVNKKQDDDHLVFLNYKLLFFQTLCHVPKRINIIESLNSLLKLLIPSASSDEEQYLLGIVNEYKNDQTTYKNTIKSFALFINNKNKYYFLKENYYIDSHLSQL